MWEVTQTSDSTSDPTSDPTSDLASNQTGKEEEETVRQLRQRLAILLVRDNVTMFDSRSPSYPQSVIDADVDFDLLP